MKAKVTKREGVIEKIEFTSGGLGNQFTTIDGKRYWTWWDIRNEVVRVGRRVRFVEALNAKVCDAPEIYGDVASHFTLIPNTPQIIPSVRSTGKFTVACSECGRNTSLEYSRKHDRLCAACVKRSNQELTDNHCFCCGS